MLRLIALCFATVLFILPQTASANTLNATEKAALQAAMVQHIDQQTVRGAFLHVDFKNGAIERLAPAKAHPMMLSMGEHFVLCTTFRRADGKDVNIDCYAAKSDRGYTIFHTEIDNRGPLMALIKAGKVRPIK